MRDASDRVDGTTGAELHDLVRLGLLSGLYEVGGAAKTVCESVETADSDRLHSDRRGRKRF